MSNSPTCPKCGATMYGPRYDGCNELLEFWCGCGFTSTRRPLDHDSSGSATIARIAEKMKRQSSESSP